MRKREEWLLGPSKQARLAYLFAVIPVPDRPPHSFQRRPTSRRNDSRTHATIPEEERFPDPRSDPTRRWPPNRFGKGDRSGVPDGRNPVSEGVCKPDSVPGGTPPGDGHSSGRPVSRTLGAAIPGGSERAAPPRTCLAPDGVCRAPRLSRAAGELLPHLFTVTDRQADRPSRFLWHFPPVTRRRR